MIPGLDHTGFARVFVVDDDAAVLNSLKFSLDVDGYDVAGYRDAAGLLAVARDIRDGCVVIDYRLPDMNGLDLATQLRERGATGPFIMITTNPSADLLRQAAAKGIEVVEKPLTTGILRSAIHTALASGRKSS